MKFLVIALCFMTMLSGCDTSKMYETPDTQFTGTWELVDRGILENIEVVISKDEKGNFKGTVVKLNDNKYVQLFMEEGDVLISGIARKSNFEFSVSEKKIAAPLFSIYGQSTTREFAATFAGKDTILLGNNGQEGKYVRLK